MKLVPCHCERSEAIFNLKLSIILVGFLFWAIPSACAETAVEYLVDGNDSYARGDLKQAIYDYTKALDINPNLAKAYDNRGVAYAKQGFLDPAIADFTMAIANKPKDAEAYNNRGHAYAAQGNLTQALADYSKAIRYNAIYVKAYNNRALVYDELKEYDKAWADVNKIKQIGGTIDPDFIVELKKESGKGN